MYLRKIILLIGVSATLVSCWKYRNGRDNPGYTTQGTKVMGYKPVYGAEPAAKQISYSATPQPVLNGGNIYAFQNYIFQMEVGYGIHVIDNTVPSAASRIGFITVKGCSQMSIKDDKLYTNSYDDLVVLDFSNLNNVHEFSRLKGVFTEYRYDSPISHPPAKGYYECPEYNNYVIGWTQDSVYQNCYNN